MHQGNKALTTRSYRPVVIIAGPTASGKSDCAVTLARLINGEIINADTAQMYTRISVGTAKPSDWRFHDIPHHLFDVCSEPIDFDVVQYRSRIVALVDEVTSRQKTPILVGGSLFYIKSLLFPPHAIKGDVAAIPPCVHALSTQQLWNHLHEIDSVRAAQIHMHDTYRVMRALAIWYDSGEKPSALVPQFKPPFPVQMLFLSPPLEQLYERINRRTELMVNAMGWIDEVAGLVQDSSWWEFVKAKGFIGYAALAEWIEAGGVAAELPTVIAHIQQDTRNYAKRQRTFWRSFMRQLEAAALESPRDTCALIEATCKSEGISLLLKNLEQ